MEELDLNHSQWDCCVIGNGVSALWLAQWLWSRKKSVLWVTSEEPFNPARAFLRHGWVWSAARVVSERVMNNVHVGPLGGDEDGSSGDQTELQAFETIYFDARSARRFRRFDELKPEWGDHEAAYFESLSRVLGAAVGGPETVTAEMPVDLWPWFERLSRVHDGGQGHGFTQVELFDTPRFVRIQGWPIVELKIAGDSLEKVCLAGLRPKQVTEIEARRFYIGDYDENLASLIKDEKAAEAFGAPSKGRVFRSGFGLQLWHGALAAYPNQTAIVPLTVNPGKGEASHVVGRIVETERGIESYWIGFLTDEEVEDNNEILKKIKQAKRAIDRAIPGFSDSVQKEAVTFEPRMWAQDTRKNRNNRALGAEFISDLQGTDRAVEMLAKIFAEE